jgi:rfaE bifunctional protein kinase chain/domain
MSFGDRLRAEADALADLLDRFAQTPVLVVGDLTLDEFITGQTERISREAPVLILRHETTRQVPGGGANALYNLAQLGAQVYAVGIIGDDSQGQVLCQQFRAVGVDVSGVVVDGDRPTVTKTRISGHARQSVTQQIVRLDRKSDRPLGAAVVEHLVAAITRQRSQVRAVVCSDYHEGVMTPAVIQAALDHHLVVVDAQKELGRYAGATIFTPNVPEAELAVGYGISERGLDSLGRDLLALTQAQQLLITRGEEGMSLCAPGGDHADIPAFNRTEVFDVTGAGDTVVAALTLGLANGGSFWQAAVLGNLAASIVVRQFGTSTTTIPELRQSLQQLLARI